MKFKTTKKEILNNYGKSRVLCVGYCKLYTALKHFEPAAYTCGVYGHNSDIYIFNDYNLAISTGYRPFGTAPDFEKLNAAEEKARKIDDSNLDYCERKKQINKILIDFIKDYLKYNAE